MAVRQGNPFLARLPEGPVRDNFSLLWTELQTLAARIPTPLLSIANVPRVRLAMDADLTVADATPTVVSWATADPLAGDGARNVFNPTLAPDRLTFPAALGRNSPSVWLAVADMAWTTNATGIRDGQLLYTGADGTVTTGAQMTLAALTGVDTIVPLVWVITDPDGNSTVQLEVTQTSGGPLDLLQALTHLTLLRLF